MSKNHSYYTPAQNVYVRHSIKYIIEGLFYVTLYKELPSANYT